MGLRHWVLCILTVAAATPPPNAVPAQPLGSHLGCQPNDSSHTTRQLAVLFGIHDFTVAVKWNRNLLLVVELDKHQCTTSRRCCGAMPPFPTTHPVFPS